jgi:NAD(P)-dependent dehydrogenase (short-subunit alcohol dehydrogenase family)
VPGYQGKVAVVTGAASGIGFAVAERAAAEGMTVVLADIDSGRLRDAAAAGSSVGISVLCPAAVATDILNSGRHRPSRLGPAAPAAERDYPPLDGVMQPAQAADIMFAGLAERRFWILTHPEQGAPAIRARAEDIVTGRNPGDESVDPNFSTSTGRTPS